MITQLEFDGMQAAYDKAERVSPGWGEVAFDAFKRVVQQMTAPFTIEQIRFVLRSQGIQSPTDERAYGQIVRRASKENIIIKTDKTAPAVSSHGSGKPLWIKAEGNNV